MNALTLIRIMQFGDSVLPVGNFAFSNGIESAIQCGVVNNVDTLCDFTHHAMQQAASGDIRAAVACCRALQAGENQAAINHDRALFNRKLNEESRVMMTRTGKKLAEVATLATRLEQVEAWLARIKSGETPGTYPVTQAVVMSALKISPRELAVISLYGMAATLLGAALRLMRISHLETQQVMFELTADIESLCDSAEQGGLEQMVSWAPVTDVLAAMHTAAWTRLFSS